MLSDLLMMDSLQAMDLSCSETRYPPSSGDRLHIDCELLNDRVFNACVELVGDHHIKISFSTGLFMSITDLTLRALSIDSYARKFDEPETKCRCYLSRDFFNPPITRYVDYRQRGDCETSSEILGQQSTGPFLAKFVKSVPLDSNRLGMTGTMAKIATMWIFLHEEGHYRRGHLHLEGDEGRMPVFQIGSKKGSIKRPECKDEVVAYSSKILEFEADQYATRALYSVWLEEYEKALLRGQITQAQFNERLVLVLKSAFVAVFALDRNRRANGEAPNYPSIHTRFTTVMGGLYWMGTSRTFGEDRGMVETFEAFWDRATSIPVIGSCFSDLVHYINREEGVVGEFDSEDFLLEDPEECILLMIYMIVPELYHERILNPLLGDDPTFLNGINDRESVKKRAGILTKEYLDLFEESKRFQMETRKFRVKTDIL